MDQQPEPMQPEKQLQQLTKLILKVQAASAANSNGGKAVAGSGQNNSGAAVKTASGDKYASVNGNVYSNTGAGWQQGGSGNSQAQTHQPKRRPKPKQLHKLQNQSQSNAAKYENRSTANQGFNQEEMNKASNDRQRGNIQTQQYQGRMTNSTASGSSYGGSRPSGGGRSRGRG
ncbi:MAG: hypothetical protein U5K51_14915 [Flavobacteriaceae bacterium]|nr:hypothetical protein [Flavobacteriaceae bacterium]